MARMLAAAVVFVVAPLVADVAAAADIPVPRHRGGQVARSERWPVCYLNRYAYVRYAPVLATAHNVRAVAVAIPVPCPAHG